MPENSHLSSSLRKLVEEGIESTRIPLVPLLYCQHTNKDTYSIEDVLAFFNPERPGAYQNMRDIGAYVPEHRIRSWMRGFPGNNSLTAEPVGLVPGTQDYIYKVPKTLSDAMRTGELRLEYESETRKCRVILANTREMSAEEFEKRVEEILITIQTYLDRKTQENKLRYRDNSRIKEAIEARSGEVEQEFFEQRKRVLKSERGEYFYLVTPTIPLDEMVRGTGKVYYEIPEVVRYIPQCPNFVFKIFNERNELEGFATLPFEEIDKEVFKKLQPDKTRQYTLWVRKKDGQLELIAGTRKVLDLGEYLGLGRARTMAQAPYTAGYQVERLKAYRLSFRTSPEAKEGLERRLSRLRPDDFVGSEATAIGFFEQLSLLRAIKAEVEGKEKTLFIVHSRTRFPDLICIFLEDLVEEERLGKRVEELTPQDLVMIRTRILTNVDAYKDRLFEVEAEYDAARFETHDGKDDVQRSLYILAWDSHFEEPYYRTKDGKYTIPIIACRELWGRLSQEVNT